MITVEQARSASLLHHKILRNADGTPQRFRVNGKCRTWKTRPGEFRIPVKRGMYEYGYVDHINQQDFEVVA